MQKLESKSIIYEYERIDNIGFNNLRLIQRPEEFCYGVDAVILACYASEGISGNRGISSKIYAADQDKICVDLGTGTGIIPLILSHKTKWKNFFAIEIQPDSYDRACRNVALNSLDGRIHPINMDIKVGIDKLKEPAQGTVDVVVSNPPYMKKGTAISNANKAKLIARHETTADLEDFMKAAASLLKDKGDLYLVHRPNRIVDICTFGRKYKLEPKRIRFVSPNYKVAPNILLMHLVKNGGNEVKTESPLYIYNEDGTYTTELLNMYEK